MFPFQYLFGQFKVLLFEQLDPGCDLLPVFDMLLA